MSIEVCILASGSAGNATLVRTPAGALLIDAGIGPRVTAQRLRGTGVDVREIRAICLTHLDHDHFSRNWVGAIVRQGIEVWCHAPLRSGVARIFEMAPPIFGATPSRAEALVRGFDGRCFRPLSGVSVRPLPLAHDDAGSHGFVIEGFGARVGYATDLGRVTADLIEQFAALDVLALESNYDRQMQLDSARPVFLKRRIMGGAGHLSNEQAFEAIRRILDGAEAHGRMPSHIVLLHRSRQCNCPRLLRQLFAADARIVPRLVLAEQYERTEWLKIAPRPALPGEQLALEWA